MDVIFVQHFDNISLNTIMVQSLHRSKSMKSVGFLIWITSLLMKWNGFFVQHLDNISLNTIMVQSLHRSESMKSVGFLIWITGLLKKWKWFLFNIWTIVHWPPYCWPRASQAVLESAFFSFFFFLGHWVLQFYTGLQFCTGFQFPTGLQCCTGPVLQLSSWLLFPLYWPPVISIFLRRYNCSRSGNVFRRYF